MSRSILPRIFRDNLEIKLFNLGEEDKKNVIDIISRTKNSESLKTGEKIADLSLGVFTSAILGALFYFAQRYYESRDSESQNSIKKDATNIDEHTSDSLIFLGSLAVLSLVAGVLIKNYVFPSNDAANKILDKISKMPHSDLEKNLGKISDRADLEVNESDRETDLAGINVSKDQFYFFKSFLANTATACIAYYSGLPDDKAYLLFGFARNVARQLLENADEALCSNIRGTEPLFEKDFLSEFSAEEIAKLREAIKSEINSNIDKDKYLKGLIRFSSELVQQLAFYGTLQASPTSFLIQEEPFASAANFGVASLSYNIVKLIAESLDDYYKIRENGVHSQAAVLNNGDDVQTEIEATTANNAGGTDGYSPLNNGDVETAQAALLNNGDDVQTEIEATTANNVGGTDGYSPLQNSENLIAPNTRTMKRSKSENNLGEISKVVSSQGLQRRNSI